ncbi:MAG: 4-(cytidine 5'-diphospho)-2-C-methyl-D-erythritol kinase [Verrucomicrobia bacterium]|nr:4-(cytidine 5'-diphospho)-2-C-methyl-D-erythritol kinase [Verrucomicrobiota bacterium]
MEAPVVFAPAKLNLYLAVTGRRADGFHDLVSVVAPLDFGDRLRAEAAAGLALRCDDDTVPTGGDNLVVKAAQAFARKTGWPGGVRFTLEKRIPMGAGLGGGSSDAVAALRALNHLAGPRWALAEPDLHEVAAELGSDCPLFLIGGPVVLRGRGERVTRLAEAGACRIRGRRVLVFKPGFGIATPWAYGQLVARAPAGYVPAAEAERRLTAWLEDEGAPVERLLANNLEAPAFAKFLALPVLLGELQRRFGVTGRMSGSGSACYVLLPDGLAADPLVAVVRAAWGESAFVQEARLE